MGTYRVRDGHQLSHHGSVLTSGDSVELADNVASDGAVAPHIEPIPVVKARVSRVPVDDKSNVQE